MTYSPYEPAPPPPGERWSLNLPVAIGVVFVFLVAVIAWVIVSSSDDDGDLVIDTSSTTSTTIESGPPIVPTSTTTPPLLPTTTIAGTPVPAGTTVPGATVAPGPTTPAAPPPPPAPTTTTTPGPTTTLEPIPTVPPGQTVPGDLAVPGYAMQQPPCNGSYITILASAVGDQATAEGILEVLEQYPNSNYLRTDQACRSLNPEADGQPIYVVYFGPFAEASDACIARAQGPQGAYARELTNGHGHEETVNCNEEDDD
jgi:hypothetical protein